MLPSLYLYVYHILWYLKCTGKVTYISRRDWILCNLFPWINSNKKKEKKYLCACTVLYHWEWWITAAGYRDGIMKGFGKLPFQLEFVTFETKPRVLNWGQPYVWSQDSVSQFQLLCDIGDLLLGNRLSLCETQDLDLSPFRTGKPILTCWLLDLG